MRRRSKAGDEPVRRRKAAPPKRRNGRKAAHRRNSSAASQETKVARLTRELNEAFQQQTATADVLKVISRSTFDLQMVLDTLLQSAARLCEAPRAVMFRHDGESYHAVAFHNASPEIIDFVRRHPIKPGRHTVTARVALKRRVIHVADLQADAEYKYTLRDVDPIRTELGVPMFREDDVVGVIILYKFEVQPFTNKQIELVRTFADQAVIAIENARLLNELRQRTDDLTESLEQQTATSEVLEVISSSPGELEPVFGAMLDRAVRICEARFGNLYLREGDGFRAAVMHNAPPAYAESRAGIVHPSPNSTLWQAAQTKQPAQTADITKLPRYVEGDPYLVSAASLGGFRSVLTVPMLHGDDLIGAITIFRQEVRPFTKKQVELLTNFAKQAVIAIENARLLNELRQRTTDLTESLEQQTATSEILNVISNSPTDVQPVLDTIVRTAVTICDSYDAVILLKDGEQLRIAAHHGPMKIDFGGAPISRNWVSGRVVVDGVPVHVHDLTAEDTDFPLGREIALRLNQRTVLGLPLLREGQAIGCLFLRRPEVRPFTEKQIGLLQTFADQAVIAIENTRLFEAEQQRTRELTESLEQQTATSEVLQVISSSPGELELVFQAMLKNAVRICDAAFGNIYRWDGEFFSLLATHKTPPAFAEARRRSPLRPGPETPLARMIVSKTIIHLADAVADPSYAEQRDPAAAAAVEIGGVRTVLLVPMLRENELVGSFTVYRQEPDPFTDKQIELVTNFANQAVIAIENVRLLNELRESLQQQTATSDVLKVISRSTFDLQTVLDTLIESAARLCAAEKGTIQMRDEDVYRIHAQYGLAREAVQYSLLHPMQPDRSTATGRVALEGRPIHIPDVLADPEYHAPDYQQAFEYRTILSVPLLREGTTIGVFSLLRDEVSPFTDKQIELATTFADQAVIAIENVRLFEAEQQRTRELTESLEQQTATSEVLQVISSSPGDLEPVFASMLEKAVRICDANCGNIYRWDGESLHLLASHNAPPAFVEARRHSPLRPGGNDPIGRMITTKTAIHLSDAMAEQAHTDEDNPGRQLAAAIELGGARTILAIPMLRENELIGSFTLFRQEVRPFTDKQITLVTSFARQAVIAIENTRLLNELRQRTGDLGRSVGELRALGEVSQAVNSTLDLETVLSTIVAKAVQLSGTEAGAIYVFDDRQRELHLRATYGMDQELIGTLARQHIGLDEANVALALAQHEPVQIADLNEAAPSAVNEIILRAGYRALLVAPLLRGEDIVGILVVRRRTPGQFARNTVDLVKTFAAQSAVAIENARLFHNVEASLEDLRTAQDRLVQTEKLASLGQLTAGIAHEIKNPLNFVNNFSAVSVELIDELREALGGVHLDKKLRADINQIADTLQGNLDKVVQHGKRADAIVKNMLLHSRQGSGEHRPVDINALVDESLNLAYHGARAEKQGFNITLERFFDPTAGEVDLFPLEITRVLLNLISNGFYAATKRKAEASGGDYEPTLAAATKNLGDSVEIRIRDNGTGITREVREKLFNPFFTTKPAGEGTGLGLSISHDIIVKQHSGSIEVDTQPGEFTEFRIILPRAAASANKSGGGA